ncbi:unannotated protein [freshwater metagenome]|uniref:Unannotated protein n=1 Tax=freshwater metagenome TaxID=449393 RepID=A0A6J6DB34_9ZZZZ
MNRAALRVADDDIGATHLLQHRGRDVTGERAILLRRKILRAVRDPETIAIDQSLYRSKIGIGRKDRDFHLLEVPIF